MTKPRIGVIGYGNMGSALLRGALSANALDEFELAVFVRKPFTALPDGVQSSTSAHRLAEWADYIIPAVKPGQLAVLFEEISEALNHSKAVVSIAAGVELSVLHQYSGNRCPVARVMPNTPAEVGKGLFGVCFDAEHSGPSLSHEQRGDISKFFSRMGRIVMLEESRFNAFSAVGGCGPAYVYYMLDAVIEASVTLGFKRDEATAMAVTLFEGAAALARKNCIQAEGECGPNRTVGPNVLREQVCSPGGMTIAGTNYLDENAVRGHIIKCVIASFEKGKNLV